MCGLLAPVKRPAERAKRGWGGTRDPSHPGSRRRYGGPALVPAAPASSSLHGSSSSARVSATAATQISILLAGSGRTLDDVGGARHIAEIVMQALPRPNRFAQRLGAVYTTGQLLKLLPARGEGPITDEAVRARRRSGRLIGVRTAEGRWVYPAFQFRLRSGRLFPREDVLELWSGYPGDWTSSISSRWRPGSPALAGTWKV